MRSAHHRGGRKSGGSSAGHPLRPASDRPWFVRSRCGRYCRIRVASREGRLLTAGYALVVAGLSWYFEGLDGGWPASAAWIVLILAATFLFILTAWRMSAPADQMGRGGRC